jgi:poly(3-hydroxybutyrate) depolymerase
MPAPSTTIIATPVRGGDALDRRNDALGIDHVTINGTRWPVKARRRRLLPFASMVELTHAAARGRAPALVVPPLSGHLPMLLRDLVAGLLGAMPVVMLQWFEPRRVPLAEGRFGFDENMQHIEAAIREVGPAAVVISLCQGAVPTLAAAARVAQHAPDEAPRSLVLIAGPVDPLANPTRVVQLVRARTLDWFRSNVITAVPPPDPGAGRLVYPASAQRTALLAHLTRHMMLGGELSWKVFSDDGTDPVGFPFIGLYLSLMDLPAELFLENIAQIFHSRSLCLGRLQVAGQSVDLGALRRTALLTVEGENDDIAAPGQTAAAHRLCRALPEDLHHRLLVRHSGHFSLFHGEAWRRKVLPAIVRLHQRFD